jgi:NADH-quinone oxidoreductase subunit N
MASDLFHSLLAEQFLLALLFVLMILEMLGVNRRYAGVLLKLTLLIGGAVLLLQYLHGYHAEPIPEEIRIDGFALAAKLLILSCGLLLSLVARAYGTGQSSTFQSAFLFAASLLGALVVMDSAGFISAFIGLEMLSLPAFALMVHGTGSSSASEAALKYLLLSSIASALILFGIAFSYGATGSLAVDAFAAAVAGESVLGLAAGMLVAAGFFLKAAVFPFHGWAPDAYCGARLQVTSFLASIVKGTIILGLVRILGTGALNSATIALVGALSLLSIYFGNFAAIRQSTFKRLLAYSSIAHAGYMSIAFADTTGARASDLLWYVAIYASTVIAACASFAVLCPDDADDVRALDGAFQSHPAAALILGLALLSLAGLPPLPGFFAKLFVFSSAIASGHLVAASVAFAGSFIGVTYYLRLFFRLFATDVPDANVGPSRREAP